MRVVFISNAAMTADATWSVVAPVALAIATNGIVALTRPPEEKPTFRNPLLPAGWVIGVVWIVLFGLFGYIAHLARESAHLVALVYAFGAFCLAYPFATGLDPSSTTAARMNAGALLFSIALIAALLRARGAGGRRAVPWAIPICAWTAYVNWADFASPPCDPAKICRPLPTNK